MSGIEHFDHELLELDRQIVRLGKLCDLDMTDQDTVMNVLSGKLGVPGDKLDVRKPFMLMRGLLELRYIVEKHCVDDIGTSRCSDVLQETLLK